MVSTNIKVLRKEKGITQKELADHLHVTAQAVSRWEAGDVEPSIDTIVEIAKYFGVSTDELLTEIKTQQEKQEDAGKERPVLAVCEACKKPIYDKDDLVTKTFVTRGNRGRRGRIGGGRTQPSKVYYICKECSEKESEIARLEREKWKEQKRAEVKKQRVKSYCWGGIIALIEIIIGVLLLLGADNHSSVGLAITIILPILTFTFISCLFLKNNFIEDVFLTVFSWGLVKFPGLIFSFSLEGIAWLIAVKMLFKVLGILIGLVFVLLAFVICLPLSCIAYPFALIKSIKQSNGEKKL